MLYKSKDRTVDVHACPVCVVKCSTLYGEYIHTGTRYSTTLFIIALARKLNLTILNCHYLDSY